MDNEMKEAIERVPDLGSSTKIPEELLEVASFLHEYSRGNLYATK